MLKILISYGRENKTVAKALATVLEEVGHEVWFDHELTGGQKWWNAILSEIRECDVFVFLITRASLVSTACRREYTYAGELGKPIIPLMIETRDIRGLPSALSNIQHLDFRKNDDATRKQLYRALNKLPPTKPLPEPLPDPPVVPISYLGDLSAEIRDESNMSKDRQSSILLDLKQNLDDLESTDLVIDLLNDFRKRRDLLASVSDEIDKLLTRKRNELPEPSPGPDLDIEVPSYWDILNNYKSLALAGLSTVVVILISVMFYVNSFEPNTDGGNQATPAASAVEIDPDSRPSTNGNGIFSTKRENEDSGKVETQLKSKIDHENAFGMKFVKVPAGRFMMGARNGDPDEMPVHAVNISEFFMEIHEVTQLQWKKVMGSAGPSDLKNCDQCPMENVSWNQVKVFIERLNALTKDGTYRLPTEAEWEFAARAGTVGSDRPSQSMAWYANETSVPKPVALKKPNPWGLYDMHGNVREWVMDWYGRYPAEEKTDPTGPPNGDTKVNRGGSFNSGAFYVRSANRDERWRPDQSDITIGFRVIMTRR